MSVPLKTQVARIREAALADPRTNRFEVVTPAAIKAAESSLGFALPRLLKRLYREVGNGGFGPGDGLIGLPGGHESSFGDLLQTYTGYQEWEEHWDTWLPIIEWGCCDFSFVDCDHGRMVSLYEGDFHPEVYSFEEMLARWVDGEVPNLSAGDFTRRTR